jgi:hypothetical protein
MRRDVRTAVIIFIVILFTLAVLGYFGYDRWSELP